MSRPDQDAPPPQHRRGGIRLASYSQECIVLPEGIRAVTPLRSAERPRLSCEAVQRLFKQTIRDDIVSLQHNGISDEIKILLLLPDATRGQDTSRILLDCLLALRREFSTLRPTIIFGLGTHPLMPERVVINALEEHRYQQLGKEAVEIKQQTSLASLPTRELRVQASDLDAQDKPNNPERALVFRLPEDLWNNHLIYTAGNSELHPYETRCGSGGIHKMITVGLGVEATITTTHSARTLRKAGQIGNPQPNSFVRIITAHANAIIKELLREEDSHLRRPPRGFNVCLDSSRTILGCQTSETDEARRPLTELLLRENSVTIPKPVSFVINDPEPSKMTDILAGARYLHMLCDSDSNDNPILNKCAKARTALLFNTCHTTSNYGGIGNTGTVEHLLALKRFNLESKGLNQSSRQQTLHRWSVYLNLRSDMRRALLFIGRSAARLSQQTAGRSGFNNRLHSRLLRFVQHIKAHADGELLKLMETVEQSIASGASAAATALVQEALDQGRIPQGLGEGGQRALRLLRILEQFDHLLIATDNKAVIRFIEELDPMQCTQTQKRNLGLTSIDLSIHSCQEALEIAMAKHREACATESVQGLFLQDTYLITLAKGCQ